MVGLNETVGYSRFVGRIVHGRTSSGRIKRGSGRIVRGRGRGGSRRSGDGIYAEMMSTTCDM